MAAYISFVLPVRILSVLYKVIGFDGGVVHVVYMFFEATEHRDRRSSGYVKTCSSEESTTRDRKARILTVPLGHMMFFDEFPRYS